MVVRRIRVLLVSVFAAAVSFGVPTDSFRVRDPFVVPSQEDGLYHLFISDQWSGGPGDSSLDEPCRKGVLGSRLSGAWVAVCRTYDKGEA